MSWDHDLTQMMGLFFRIVESEKGKAITPGEEWRNDGQVLAVKIFRHIATAQQISAGLNVNLPGLPQFSYIDHSSVSVVVRAAIEVYLTFSYVFAGDDVALSKYRHKLWTRSGLIDRSKMLANTEESRTVLEKEKQMIDKLASEIFESPFYKQSNRDDRKIIKNGGWKPQGGLYSVSAHADLHQIYFSDIYNHLSGHAHCSFISAIQIRDAVSIEDQQMLAGGSRQILCMIIAHFMFSYIKLFPAAELIFQENQGLYEIAFAWFIQKKDLAKIYGQ